MKYRITVKLSGRKFIGRVEQFSISEMDQFVHDRYPNETQKPEPRWLKVGDGSWGYLEFTSRSAGKAYRKAKTALDEHLRILEECAVRDAIENGASFSREFDAN